MEKRTRFVKVVETRVNRVLHDLDSLSKCSNKRNYQFSEEDVGQIFRAIEKKVREVKSSFNGKVSEEKQFKLKRS